MGHSRASKAESHARVVKVAAARFREVGIEGISVADLMKDAGLTVGGFYKHFESRDALVAEAVEQAIATGAQAIAAMAANPQATLAMLVDGYLSAAHRDNLAASCAVTTLASDVSRSNERARTAYTEQVGRYLELIVKLIGGEKDKARRMRAITALSTLVGAVAMSRAVNDAELSAEILKSAAEELKAQAG